MSQDAVHGRGTGSYPSRILEQKRLAITGGVAELVHRVAAPEGEARLATDRHAIGFTFILPTKLNDVFFCGERIWSGRTAGARFAIIPAIGETTTEVTGVGAEKYLVLFLEPGSMLRAANDEPGAGGALTPFWGESDPLSWQLADALRVECEAGAPHGLLYADTATTMLSLHMLRHHSTLDR